MTSHTSPAAMAERFKITDQSLTSIQASIDRVQKSVAGPSTLALNRNQCAYLSEAQLAVVRFLQREDVRQRVMRSRASAALLIQLDSVVKRAEDLVDDCYRSIAWPEGALNLFNIKYDVLDILNHLQWWMSVLRKVVGIPFSKLSAADRVQLLNREFEQKLLSFDDLSLAAEDDKRELLKVVKAEIQATERKSPGSDAHLLLLQVYALLTDQDGHSNPQLNKFTSDCFLGKGGFGEVYKVKWCGYDCVLKKYYPLKRDDVEVKSLKSLRHPHIVRFFRHWKSDSKQKFNSHILMERMDRDLQDHISAEMQSTEDAPPFSLPVAIQIMLQVISAVWHMHNNNFVHRDLKPKNVLVRKCSFLPEGYVGVKLGDFGIAKADMKTSNAGPLTFKLGTAPYRAPELSQKEYTDGARNFPRGVDIWSFGIMCSQILTGLPPFPDFEGNALHEHIKEGGRPYLPDDCPGYLRYCIERCWEFEPENRPRAADVWRMLRIAQLRILGVVDERCDSLFGYINKQGIQVPPLVPPPQPLWTAQGSQLRPPVPPPQPLWTVQGSQVSRPVPSPQPLGDNNKQGSQAPPLVPPPQPQRDINKQGQQVPPPQPLSTAEQALWHQHLGRSKSLSSLVGRLHK